MIYACELTGYTRGKLPFRYLGVPILAKKLSAVEPIYVSGQNDM